MVSTTFGHRLGAPAPAAPRLRIGSEVRSDSRYQAYLLMRVGYTVLPLAMGIDKFFNGMVYWPRYLAGWIDDIAPGTAQQFMYVVGAVEILAGLLVLLKPRYAAYVVAGWLAGIVVDLFSTGNWWDVGVRDFGLMLGALTLGRLAAHYDPPLRRR
jgi:uncharacterized membrane protein YphA (DoxX/SURF4 family)